MSQASARPAANSTSSLASPPVGTPVDAGPAALPGPVTLEGLYARIEKLDAKRHGGSLWRALAGDDGVWTYLAHGPFAREGAFQVWLEERAVLADPYAYAVVDRQSDDALGIVTLMEIRPAMRVVEMGSIVYSQALQRTRVATEAQYLMARYAFEGLGYRRYEWKCNDLNQPSRRAALRYGFTYEGTFRQHMIVKGRNRDTAWYAMLDGDWPDVRAAFEGWLDPGNFDITGEQKRSLSTFRKE